MNRPQRFRAMIVSPTSLEFKPRYTRLGDEYVLREKGRWGPRWLQRFVFWTAKNLGMVGHPKAFDETIRYQTIDLADIRRAAEQAILAVMDLGYTPNDLEIIVGTDQFDGLCMLAKPIHAELELDIHSGSRRWRGVRLSVVPWVQGLVVVPRVRREHSR